MAETLLAILLVTSSAKGPSLVYRWPPAPEPSARLARPRPAQHTGAFQLDNPGRAAFYSEGFPEKELLLPTGHLQDDDDEYEWKRPESIRDRSMSFSRTAPRPSSGRNSPTEDASYNLDSMGDVRKKDEYDDLFGYSSEFLAGLLCPHRSLCHQKFELVVDDLAFIGHPVCADDNGAWRFKPEKLKSGSRGRGSRNRQLSQLDEAEPEMPTPVDQRPPTTRAGTWLQKFHLVVALDLPDPSSSASGNISKYFDIIYEQIAFTVTAVLFQEQVISNFVEAECESLGSLKDEYMSKGGPQLDLPSINTQTHHRWRRTICGLYEPCSAGILHSTCDEIPIRGYQVVDNGQYHDSRPAARATASTIPRPFTS